ncbi:hypothetical protein AB1Y20_004394 [Prymnesium parvum]|uniref:Prolyl 4-hydroxylase alpha subunit Fe(2+) 2OG dioxygenase domain-containing protein n=1 Tax=Prymnesium parvum TaxID=97485 RepID=A0AB34J052_PRYPA
MALLVAAPLPAAAAVPRVWDAVFRPSQLAALDRAASSRAHSFTSVLDRRAFPSGRTIVEQSLCSLLQQLGDEAPYVEYWWRGTHIDMPTHRDVDEALCRSRKHAGRAAGVQVCPAHAHVLYLSLPPELRAPTCVWEEAEPTSAWAREAAAVGGTPCAGAARRVERLHVVPAVAGRLLRFRGELLHAVPQPALRWVSAEGAPRAAPARRSVLLFNTWHTPPLLPPPTDPPPPHAAAALAALREAVACEARREWVEAGAAPPRDGGGAATVRAPLLGDAVRRGGGADALLVEADADALAAALASERAWHSVAVRDVGRAARDDGAGRAPWQAAAEVDEEEELALKLGYAEHLEAEFFGVGDEEEEEEEEEMA